ncbi:MAG: hypothetical protein QOD98_1390, partial [Nocardioidaceae bacterium]|nr:hypothetical protein [Nocardioidaceae bacterium]
RFNSCPEDQRAAMVEAVRRLVSG